MVLSKRTYNLPAERVEDFERIVPPGKRSAIIGQLMEHWLEEQRVAALRAEIEIGLTEQAELYAEIERQWAPLSDEVWAQLPDEEWPPPKEIW